VRLLALALHLGLAGKDMDLGIAIFTHVLHASGTWSKLIGVVTFRSAVFFHAYMDYMGGKDSVTLSVHG
jgi:hypothetical protein